MELTILMPCLNEAGTLAACIAEAMQYLSVCGCTGEVLICDNGCTDDSVAIARRLGARVVLCPEPGYGNALRCGMQQAKGRLIIMGDCDGSYDFLAIGEMHRLLREEADVVIGNRFASAPDPQAITLLHRVGVAALSWMGRVRFGCGVRDFHCGLRGIRAEALNQLHFTCGGMEFATEMIAQAVCHDLTIAQTPVALRPDGRNGPSHLRVVRDGVRHLWYILQTGRKKASK